MDQCRGRWDWPPKVPPFGPDPQILARRECRPRPPLFGGATPLSHVAAGQILSYQVAGTGGAVKIAFFDCRGGRVAVETLSFLTQLSSCCFCMWSRLSMQIRILRIER
jgi:hypothetical protein